jgi:integrase
MSRGPYRTKPLPGSFAELILRYRQSPRVLAWGPATLRKNDRILAQFMDANARFMVADFRRGDFIALRDSMGKTPSEANNWAKVIRGMLDYAVDLEVIPFNPAARVKRLKVPNPDGYRTWRDDEIEAFQAHWPRGSLPRLTLTLALCSGAARGDLVRLGWPNVSGARLRYRRQKTGASVDIPILPALEDELTQVSGSQMTFLETRTGTVRSGWALGNLMARWVAEAGLGGKDASGHLLSLHGIRKAAARQDAERGGSPYDLMAKYGWTDIKQAEVYCRQFNRARGADRLAELQAAAEKQKQPQKVTRLRRPKG